MTLHEIDSALMGCFDTETGEVDVKRYENLQMERTKKIESIALWILQLRSDENAIADEIDRLTAKKKAVEKKREQLKNYLITATNGESFKTPFVSVSKPRNYEKLVIDNPDAIPEGFYTVVETKKLDTAAVKQAVAGGWKTDAAHIEITQSVIIR